MIPRTDITAFTVAGALGAGVIPVLPAGHYAIGTTAVSASLLFFMGQEMDRAVVRRVAEIERVVGLLRDGAALAGQDGETWLEAGATPLPPLSVAALDAHRRPLLEALAALHVWLEGQTTAAARVLEGRLLEHLRVTADSKALVLPPSG